MNKTLETRVEELEQMVFMNKNVWCNGHLVG